jgi:hypothetical protein
MPGTERSDHSVDLPVGATLLLYTDGLTERRGEDADEGIARLAALLGELGEAPLEQLCDLLLERLLPAEGAEDDVALLAVRVHDEGRPRPAEAGANHTPDPTRADADPREAPAADPLIPGAGTRPGA